MTRDDDEPDPVKIHIPEDDATVFLGAHPKDATDVFGTIAYDGAVPYTVFVDRGNEQAWMAAPLTDSITLSQFR